MPDTMSVLDVVDQELLQNETEETILTEDEQNIAMAFQASSSGFHVIPQMEEPLC